jgi:outer membrane protein assembly factor BamB
MNDNRSRLFAMIAVCILFISNALIFEIQTEKEIVEDNALVNSFKAPEIPERRSTRAGTNWPMFNLDETNAGFTPDTGPITDEILWLNQTGGTTYGSPAVVDGVVYIGGGNFMNAFYASNGTLKWQTSTLSPVPGGYGLSSSPAVDNGYVFFGGDRLYCLWANNGTIKWTIWTTAGSGASYGDGTPTVANNKVFMPADDRKLYCIDQDTGSVIWTFQTNSGNPANYGLFAAPAVVDGLVYLSAPDGNLYQINETQPGPIAIANHTFPMPYASYTAPVVANGRVFVGCGYGSFTTSNRFYALDAADLTQIWEFYPGSSTSFFVSAGFYNNRLYVPSRDGNLYCLDAMSAGPFPTEYWRVSLGNQIWSGPAITKDILYIGSQSNYVYAINLSQPASPFYYWRYNMGGDVDGSPAVVDGKVYVSTHGNGGRIYCFGNLSVIPTIDSIEIVSDPSGAGAPILDQPLNVGVQITGYAAAYNDTFGYLFDIPVNWTVSNLGTNASTYPLLSSTSSTFYSGFFGGSAQWIADDGNGHSDTVTFTINSPTLDSIQIVDTPGSGLAQIADITVDVGYSILGYAASFNDTIGYLNDISVTWSVTNTSSEGYTTPTSGTNSTLNVGLLGGTVLWTADDLAGHTDSVLFTVNIPTVDYIIIRTGPNGTGSWVGDMTFFYGDSITFYAAGYNFTANWIEDVSATWISNDTLIGDVILGPSESTTFSALTNGTCFVEASYLSSTNATGVLSVINYTMDYIIIRDAPNNMGNPIVDWEFSVGESTSFYAAGYNNSVGYIGDVTVIWESSNTSVGNVTSPGSQTAFSARSIAGDCIITARYNATISDETGTLTVVSASLDYILITDSPDGVELTSVTLNVGEQVTVYASGYNSTGLYVGLVEVQWSQSPLSIGSFSIPLGSSSVFTAGNSGGSTDIAGTNSTLSLTDDFVATIIDPTVDYIQIRDAALGLGNVVTTGTYSLNEIDEFFAAAYNHTVGYMQDIEVAWSSDDPGSGSVTSPGINTTFVTHRVDFDKVVYITANLIGQIFNSTGPITVLAPSVDYFNIVDVNNNLLSSIIFDIDDSIICRARGYNNSVGSLGYIEVTWSVWPTIVNVSVNFGTSTNVSAHVSGITTLRAEYSVDIEGIVSVTVREPISTPSGLLVTAVEGGGKLTLIWDANSEDNLAGYHIYRSFSHGGEFTRITQDIITTTTFTHESLQNGVQYFYYIVAVDTKDRLSDPSDIANGIPDIDTDLDGTPNYADSDDDNDGLSDFEEVKLGTNPLLNDTDEDGYSDLDDAYPLDPNKWEKSPEEGLPFLLLLIIIIVIVVVLLLLFLISKRNKKEEIPPPMESKKDLPPPPSKLKAKEDAAIDDEELPPPDDEDDLPPSDDKEPDRPEKEELPPKNDEEIPKPDDEEDITTPDDKESPKPEEDLPPPDD